MNFVCYYINVFFIQNKSANICEEKLYAAISKSYSENTAMLTNVGECPATIHCEDVVDALFVKAIHEGVAAVHEASIRESETAGTTLCSLFLVPIEHQMIMNDMRHSSTAEPWQPPQADMAAAELGLINTTDCGRSYKVMCANVGDSRCVMVGCSAEPVVPASSDRIGSLSGENTLTRNMSAAGDEHSTPYVRRGSFSGKQLSPHQGGEHDTAQVRRGSVSAKETKTSIQSGKIFDKLKRYNAFICSSL